MSQLPLGKPNPRGTQPTNSVRAIRARGAVTSIVVLDDNEDVAASIAQSLNRAGLRAAWATTEEEFFAAIHTGTSVHCVIADWTLGQGTARDAISKFRSLEGHAETPVIVLSGNLCVKGRPRDENLSSAVDEFRLLFRAKPITTAAILRDLKALDGDGLSA